MARTLAAICLIACAATTPRLTAADSLIVFAAASLADALRDVTAAWEMHGHAKTTTVLAASSTLARQIEQGAEADLYISANATWVDYLDERRLLREATRVNLLGNDLVLVAPRDSEPDIRIAPRFALAAALGDGLLAVGDPAHVPVGIYARQALEHLGVWQSVERRLTRSDNVRAALALVARAETPLGIVYASDALAEPGVRVVDTFPPGSHDPIVYPAAIPAASRHPEARLLLEFLASDEAARRLQRFGFRSLR